MLVYRSVSDILILKHVITLYSIILKASSKPCLHLANAQNKNSTNSTTVPSRELIYPIPKVLFESMIFPTSRLVGYVRTVLWRVLRLLGWADSMWHNLRQDTDGSLVCDVAGEGQRCLDWYYLLMVQKSSVHQLRLVVYPIIYQVLYVPSGCLGFLNHQKYHSIIQLVPIHPWSLRWKPANQVLGKEIPFQNHHQVPC